MGEHSGRYATVVDALAPDGWAVYGLDHRGHGRSGGTRVHVRRYADFLADLDTFRRAVVARHPGPAPVPARPQHGRPDRARLRPGPPGRPRRPRALGACPAGPARAARRPGGRDGAGPGGADAAPGRRRPRDDQPRRGRRHRLPDRRPGPPGPPHDRAVARPRRADDAAARPGARPAAAAAGAARHRRPDLPSRRQPGAGDGGGHGRPDRPLVRRALARDLPRAGAGAAARGPAGVARGTTASCPDISGTVRSLGGIGHRGLELWSHVRVLAAVLGEIWGTRRAHHFDQCCRPS